MEKVAGFAYFLVLFPLVQTACDVGWLSHGLFCYYISPENRTANFEDAASSCQDYSATLLYLDDEVENRFIYNSGPAISGQAYWIGYRNVLGDIWRWLINDRVGNYQKWDIAEPDNQGGCARLVPYNIGAWRDYPCDLRQNYICKKAADCGTVPEMIWGADVAYSRAPIPSLGNLTFFGAGTIGTYTCLEGFEFEDGSLSKETECAVGGLWRPRLAGIDECIPKRCQEPPALMNTVSNHSGDPLYEFGSIIEYMCSPGYWFDPYSLGLSRYFRCSNDKSWKVFGGDGPVDCSQVICQRPVTENAVANASSNQRGVAVFYRCNKGSSFPDNSTEKTFVCGDQTWIPPSQKCEPFQCPEHEVENASPSTNESWYDTLAVWTCNKGMLFADTSSRKAMYCQENKQWDRTIDEPCMKKTCTQPPPNATNLQTYDWNSTRGYKFRDTVTYTCINPDDNFPGQPLKPTRDRFCNEDAQWEPETIGECTSEVILLVTEHPPVEAAEAKNAPIVGSSGLLLLAILALLLVILDVTTISKHLKMMRDNLCPAKEEKVEVSAVANKWKSKMAAKRKAAEAPKKTRIVINGKKEQLTTNDETQPGPSKGMEQIATPKHAVSVYHGSSDNLQQVV